MEVLLDTNFIISCVMKKIDFAGELRGMGFNPVVPKGVLEELKDLRGETNRDERVAIDVAFEILQKSKIKKVTLAGKSVDDSLILKGRKGVFVATLDNGIKREVSNKIVIDSARRGLKVERS